MRDKWSEIEIELLKINFEKKTNNELLLIFPNRSLSSIKNKAKKLLLKRNKDTIYKIKSEYTSGDKNGMYKNSIHKNRVLSNDWKNKLSIAANVRDNSNYKGDKNGMFGKTPWNKNINSELLNAQINFETLNEEEKYSFLKKKKTIERISLREIQRKQTKIEKIIEDILVSLNLNYIRELKIGYYSVDFIFENKIIEVQGDYWHANPLKYDHSNLSNIQRKNVNRDKSKKTYLEYKFKLLYIWEYDIYNDLEKVKHDIIEFIKD